MSFKEENQSLQTLLGELDWLRKHNQNAGDSPGERLLFAEAALALMVLERFLRILPGVHAENRETLPRLLQRAIDLKILRVPLQEDGSLFNRVKNFRNSLFHGNHEQAAKQAGKKSVSDFIRSHFVSELNFLHQLLELFLSQIDSETGKRRRMD